MVSRQPGSIAGSARARRGTSRRSRWAQYRRDRDAGRGWADVLRGESGCTRARGSLELHGRESRGRPVGSGKSPVTCSAVGATDDGSGLDTAMAALPPDRCPGASWRSCRRARLSRDCRSRKKHAPARRPAQGADARRRRMSGLGSRTWPPLRGRLAGRAAAVRGVRALLLSPTCCGTSRPRPDAAGPTRSSPNSGRCCGRGDA